MGESLAVQVASLQCKEVGEVQRYHLVREREVMRVVSEGEVRVRVWSLKEFALTELNCKVKKIRNKVSILR